MYLFGYQNINPMRWPEMTFDEAVKNVGVYGGDTGIAYAIVALAIVIREAGASTSRNGEDKE